MIRGWIARFRPAPEPPPPAPDDAGEDAFLRSLLDSPVEPRGSRAAPSWQTDTRAAPKHRPYLEVSREELARYGTLKDPVKGPRAGDQLRAGTGRFLDRVLFGPLRDIFANVHVIVTGAFVIGATMGVTWVIVELARWYLGPLTY